MRLAYTRCQACCISIVYHFGTEFASVLVVDLEFGEHGWLSYWSGLRGLSFLLASAHFPLSTGDFHLIMGFHS